MQEESYRSKRGRSPLMAVFSLRLLLGFVLGWGSLILFAKLSEDLIYNELFQFDRVLTGIVRWNVTPELTRTMAAISNLGSAQALLAIMTVSVFFLAYKKRHFWDAFLVPIVLAGGFILNETLKRAFHRPRPSLPHLVKATGLSFPSGHAMVSLAFYGLLIYLIWVNFESKLWKWTASLSLGAIILLIGLSRVYLGVHYPSDVLAGFAAGTFWLLACILGLKGIRYYKSERQGERIREIKR